MIFVNTENSNTQAIEKFETVKRLFPQHSEVDKLIQECQGKIVAAR